MTFPTEWKNKTCSKPPTSFQCTGIHINQQWRYLLGHPSSWPGGTPIAGCFFWRKYHLKGWSGKILSLNRWFGGTPPFQKNLNDLPFFKDSWRPKHVRNPASHPPNTQPVAPPGQRAFFIAMDAGHEPQGVSANRKGKNGRRYGCIHGVLWWFGELRTVILWELRWIV